MDEVTVYVEVAVLAVATFRVSVTMPLDEAAAVLAGDPPMADIVAQPGIAEWPGDTLPDGEVQAVDAAIRGELARMCAKDRRLAASITEAGEVSDV